MDDEPAIDLSSLVPPDPTDQAKPAVRRFRVKAVAAALALVLLVLGAVGLVISKMVDQRKFMEDSYAFQTTPQWLTQWGHVNCSTPTYDVGGSELVLLEVAENRPMDAPSEWPKGFGPATGWLFHFAIRPLTVPNKNLVESLDGNKQVAALDEIKIVPIDPPGGPGYTNSVPGWTWTQLYPSIPWPTDGDITMQLEGASGGTHQFRVNLDAVLCNHDPSNGEYIGPT